MIGILHIVVARKPIEGTVAQNCLHWGCGALNIDKTRIAYLSDADKFWKHRNGKIATGGFNPAYVGSPDKGRDTPTEINNLGRWPANLIVDQNEEVVRLFPLDCLGGSGNGMAKVGEQSKKIPLRRGTLIPRYDSGSASRFFFSYHEQEIIE
jgi:site-specific DNA-methyltransferase (adenine-specific)